MIKLIVGLGNPGPEYEDTRHNAGFWWVEALARQLKVHLQHERGYQGLLARTQVNGQTLWLLEPQTFMNASGTSVAALARFYKIEPEQVLVVHDELDVVPGEAKLKLAAAMPATMACATFTPNWAQMPTGACAWALGTPA